MARRKEPVIPDTILDQLLAGADAKTAFVCIGIEVGPHAECALKNGSSP